MVTINLKHLWTDIEIINITIVSKNKKYYYK
jgi:hypothetical protein